MSLMSQTPSDVAGGYKGDITGTADKGFGAINSFDPNATSSENLSGQNSIWGNQSSAMNDYIKNYTQAVKSNPSVTDLYTTGNQMFNVPQLTQEANTLNNAVLNTPNQVVNAAKGFNFDNNQVGLDTSTILGRLAPAAQAATTNAQNAQTLAGNYVQAGQAQNAMNLLPVQAQAPLMTQIWAQQATGWNSAQQQRMDGLIAKMNAGVQLSQAEMQELASLANTEQSYQNTLASAQSSIEGAQIGNQNYVLKPSESLYNTVSGKTYTAA